MALEARAWVRSCLSASERILIIWLLSFCAVWLVFVALHVCFWTSRPGDLESCEASSPDQTCKEQWLQYQLSVHICFFNSECFQQSSHKLLENVLRSVGRKLVSGPLSFLLYSPHMESKYSCYAWAFLTQVAPLSNIGKRVLPFVMCVCRRTCIRIALASCSSSLLILVDRVCFLSVSIPQQYKPSS